MEIDPRFKLLLTTFFREFLELFFPEFAERIDWRGSVEFLDKELQGVLPERPKGVVDLLVKVRSKKAVRGKLERLLLIHVEVEGRKSRHEMGRRMCRYFHRIDEVFGLPILPIVVYVRVGADGIGWQTYDIKVWDQPINEFHFPYIGLPALDGISYLDQPNAVAWALTGLMNVPADERARVKVESLRRVADQKLKQRQQAIVVECIEGFTVLDKRQVEEYERLISSQDYEEAVSMHRTIFDDARDMGRAEGIEQGREQGREEGREEGIEQGREELQCSMLEIVLERRFGRVSQRNRRKIEQMDSDQRQKLFEEAITAASLSELDFG